MADGLTSPQATSVVGGASSGASAARTDSTAKGAWRRRHRSGWFVELIRLVVVVLSTAAAFDVATNSQMGQDLRDVFQGSMLALVLLGSCVGYVAGGVFGRFTLGRIDAAERSLRSFSPGEMFSAMLGGAVGLALSAGLAWPLLLLDAKHIGLPLAALVTLLVTATGLKVGYARGGDLLRFLGASGRLSVTTPSHGGRAKVVDTSAFVDGRLLDVCRLGFLEGTLVVPRFVLYELQGLADSAEGERRTRGRRGLDVLAALQRSSGIAMEVTDRDYPDFDTVDAKLVAMSRERQAVLVTVDGNLGRVAEVQGVKVLNLHALADVLRPPVLPGDVLAVRILKTGKEAGQGVGYLEDGTMVVVEGAADRLGSEVTAEVTSILNNANGRMVFASTSVPPPRLLRGAFSSD